MATKRIRRRRRELLKADPTCWYCGRELTDATSTIDHFHARRKKLRVNQLKLCCVDCNRTKADYSARNLVCPLERGLGVFLIWEIDIMAKTIGFNYDVLQEEHRDEARQHAQTIRGLIQANTKNVLTIGQRLQEMRDRVGSRFFDAWIKAEFHWSQTTASDYMRAAKSFSGLGETVERFQPSALFELARNRVDTRVVEESIDLARSGRTITRKLAQEIVGKYQSNGQATPRQRDALNKLRSGLKSLQGCLDEIAERLTRDEMDALADELLNLAVQLRSAGKAAREQPATTTKPVSKRTRNTPATAKPANGKPAAGKRASAGRTATGKPQESSKPETTKPAATRKLGRTATKVA